MQKLKAKSHSKVDKIKNYYQSLMTVKHVLSVCLLSFSLSVNGVLCCAVQRFRSMWLRVSATEEE